MTPSRVRRENDNEDVAEFTKTTLIGGVLVILPICVALLLMAKTVGGLLALLRPVTAQIPAGVQFRRVLVLVIACFVVGLIVRTGSGLRAKTARGAGGAGAAAGPKPSCRAWRGGLTRGEDRGRWSWRPIPTWCSSTSSARRSLPRRGSEREPRR